jgi:RNA polymerase-binding transcription factor
VSGLNVNVFLGALEAQYQELSFSASNRDEIIVEATADEIDRLQQQVSRDIAVRNLDRTSALLRNIRAALDRIEDETYGVCLRCEEPIPEKRLKAIPWASNCVDCQEMIDRHESEREGNNDTITFAA